MYRQCVVEGRGRGGGRTQKDMHTSLIHYSIAHLMRIRWTATYTYVEQFVIKADSNYLCTFACTYIIIIIYYSYIRSKVHCEKMYTPLPHPSSCPTHLAGRSTAPLSCSVEAVSAAQTPSHLRPPSWPSCPPLLPPGGDHHHPPPPLG